MTSARLISLPETEQVRDIQDWFARKRVEQEMYAQPMQYPPGSSTGKPWDCLIATQRQLSVAFLIACLWACMCFERETLEG